MTNRWENCQIYNILCGFWFRIRISNTSSQYCTLFFITFYTVVIPQKKKSKKCGRVSKLLGELGLDVFMFWVCVLYIIECIYVVVNMVFCGVLLF